MVTYPVGRREQAKDFEFREQTDDRILEDLLQTIKDNDLIKKRIQKKIDSGAIFGVDQPCRSHQSAVEGYERRLQSSKSKTPTEESTRT